MARFGWARALAGAALITVVSASGAYAGSCTLPAWGAGPPLGVDVYGVAVTSGGGFIWAAGGYSFTAGAGTTQFRRYDIAANTWMVMASLPTSATMGTLAYDAVGGRLFLFGGTNSTVSNVLNITQIYTIATNTWAAGPVMPGPRSFMSSGVVGGMIYLIGGYSTTLVTPSESQVWRFDPVGGTFTTLAPMTAGKGGAGSGVYQGKIYVMGGRDGAVTQLNTNYEYTVATDTWATRAPLTTAVNVPASASLGGSGTCNQTFILAGGGNPFFHGGEALPRGHGAIETTGISQTYDAVVNAWSPGPSLSQGRSFAAAAQQGDTLVVVGGYNGATTVQTVDRIQGPPLPVSLSGFSVQ